MTVRVGIIENPLDPSGWVDREVEDVCAFLMDHFKKWPETARIYDLEGFETFNRAAAVIGTHLISNRDVTPQDKAGVERLQGLAGPLLVTVAPADPVTIIIAVVAVVVGLAAAFLLMPRPPDIKNQYQSPNNSLADRTNQPRPGSRIPDIFGTVRSTPDLLAVPFKRFENNVEVEIAYMCVGRGEYDLSDVRDGDTRLTSIAGASAIFYGPNTSPNSGAPQLSIGATIDEPVLSTVKMNDVNGQLLRPPNGNSISGDNNIRFAYPDLIECDDSDIDFTKSFATGDALTVSSSGFTATTGGTFVVESAQAAAPTISGQSLTFAAYDPTVDFAPGESVTLSNAVFVVYDSTGAVTYVADLNGTYVINALGTYWMQFVNPAAVNPNWNTLVNFPGGLTPFQYVTLTRAGGDTTSSLDGTYTVLAVTANTITLDNPVAVNPTWAALAGLPGGATDWLSPTLSTSGEHWVGPFIIDLDDLDRVLANFIALQGLYRVSQKGKQSAEFVSVLLELTPVDDLDAPSGPAEDFNITLQGSASNKEQVGVSLLAQPTFVGRCSVRCRRISATDLDYDGTIVDEVKWRDGYGQAAVVQTDFGIVTTVHTRTYGTSGATSVKERKLNLTATRRLPARIGGSDFTGTLFGTDSADDIISAITLDPHIGNRPVGQVDFDSIYDTIADVAAYFGSPLAKEFGYTFDDDNISFEEMVQTVAQAAFCRAYRLGSQIKLAFEQYTPDSVLLFNHRNILPGTQKRTVTFGIIDDQDGVQLEWTDPKDGALRTYSIPTDRSGVAPRKVSIPGIRSYELAYWQAWRAWNKLQYQKVSLEQECTQEAALVMPNDRVRITDQTRPPGMEGEILAQDGLDLLLSQPADLSAGPTYTMFIQHIDGTVEALTVVEWVPPDGWVQGPGEYPANHWATLTGAARLPLAVDPDLSARAHYEIVPSIDQRSRAYLVTEREPQSNFTETVRAINYSSLYYASDELSLWLPFTDQNVEDQSAWQRPGALGGGGEFVVDDERNKFVYQAAAAGASITYPPDLVFLSPDAYTKAVWVYRTADQACDLMGAIPTAELFGFDDTGHLQASNGPDIAVTGAVGPVVNLNEWHHVVVTYDGNANRHMILYVDGIEVAANMNTGRGGLTTPTVLTDFVGRADDFRLWKRAFDSTEIRALYRATRLGLLTAPTLGTEMGGILTTEDGSQLGLE